MRVTQVFKHTIAMLTVAALVCYGAPVALAQSTQTVDTCIGKLECREGTLKSSAVAKISRTWRQHAQLA